MSFALSAAGTSPSKVRNPLPLGRGGCQRTIVGEGKGLQGSLQLLSVEAELLKGDFLTIVDVDAFREDGDAHSIHTRTQHCIGNDVDCYLGKKLVKGFFVKPAINALVGEEIDTGKIGPHTIGRIVEHKEQFLCLVGNIFQSVQASPELCQLLKFCEELLITQHGIVIPALEEIAQGGERGIPYSSFGSDVIHVTREELYHGRCAGISKDLFRQSLKLLPANDELILATEFGKVIIELGFEDVGIRERQTTVIERGEDAQRCVLGLSLNGQQNDFPQDTGGKIADADWAGFGKLINVLPTSMFFPHWAVRFRQFYAAGMSA